MEFPAILTLKGSKVLRFVEANGISPTVEALVEYFESVNPQVGYFVNFREFAAEHGPETDGFIGNVLYECVF